MIDRENEITERQCGRDVESRKKKWFFFSSLQLFSYGEIVCAHCKEQIPGPLENGGSRERCCGPHQV